MTERPNGAGNAETAADLTPAPLLALAHVGRRFGDRTVLDDVSITVLPGELHLLVGPNGSGKSTLQRLGAGLLRCHGGLVTVAGADPRHSSPARRAIGFLGHQSGLYDELSAVENLAFAARLFAVPNPAGAIAEALDRVAIGPDRAVPVRRLSRGTVQRVAIARSLLHRPRLLLWDEPLTGLDGPSVERVVELIGAARVAGLGILLATHDLEPLWPLGARVHLLSGGVVRFSGDTRIPLADFRRRYAEVTGG